ncbi:hypothetical protein EIP91_000433 [Steccherinum ochraceum]|uniref:Protein-S-isoprenylcysteine O-methyltransferase n=1 Tax=Steccherinum ochraceum TaxID=92696 RepID=A0A4R0RTI6_9APHY|nr:hypothetical protein EIP91_000433 [Steccherinum ochraceum]
MVCYRTLGRHFTFELAFKKDHQLITDGPYSFVRHPAYLGMFVVMPSMVVAQFFSPGTWWTECRMWDTLQGQAFGGFWVSLAVWVGWVLVSRVPKEDKILKMQFREQWVNWSERTPYAMIPYIW